MTSQTVKLDGFFPSWTEELVLLDDDVYVGVKLAWQTSQFYGLLILASWIDANK